MKCTLELCLDGIDVREATMLTLFSCFRQVPVRLPFLPGPSFLRCIFQRPSFDPLLERPRE